MQKFSDVRERKVHRWTPTAPRAKASWPRCPGSLLALSLTALALHLRPPVGSNSQSASSDANFTAPLALHDSRRRSPQSSSPSPHRAPHCRRARRAAPSGCWSTLTCSSTQMPPRRRDCSASPHAEHSKDSRQLGSRCVCLTVLAAALARLLGTCKVRDRALHASLDEGFPLSARFTGGTPFKLSEAGGAHGAARPRAFTPCRPAMPPLWTAPRTPRPAANFRVARR